MESKKTKREKEEINFPEANEWTKEQLEDYNIDDELINVFDEDIDEIVIPKSLEILTQNNEYNKILINCTAGEEETSESARTDAYNLNEAGKIDIIYSTLVDYFITSCRNADYSETNVDSFVRLLLTILKLSNPLKNTSIAQNVKTKIRINKQEREVITDVSVIISNIHSITNIQFLTCEDKTIQSKTNDDNLYAQAVAEILAAYHTNINSKLSKTFPKIKKIVTKYTMPFITVKGETFIFYLVTNPNEKYFEGLEEGKLSKTNLKILRISQLKFSKIKERIKIIKTLLFFKELIESNTVKIYKIFKEKDTEDPSDSD